VIARSTRPGSRKLGEAGENAGLESGAGAVAVGASASSAVAPPSIAAKSGPPATPWIASRLWTIWDTRAIADETPAMARGLPSAGRSGTEGKREGGPPVPARPA
jgi:hypothetical protein